MLSPSEVQRRRTDGDGTLSYFADGSWWLLHLRSRSSTPTTPARLPQDYSPELLLSPANALPRSRLSRSCGTRARLSVSQEQRQLPAERSHFIHAVELVGLRAFPLPASAERFWMGSAVSEPNYVCPTGSRGQGLTLDSSRPARRLKSVPHSDPVSIGLVTRGKLRQTTPTLPSRGSHARRVSVTQLRAFVRISRLEVELEAELDVPGRACRTADQAKVGAAERHVGVRELWPVE